MKIFPGSFEKTHTWYKLALPIAEACCSEGSPYSIFLKKGNSNNLIVYFSGGGASWNEHTAARPNSWGAFFFGKPTYYFPKVVDFLEGLTRDGILKANDPGNPFNDWNILSLPYGTGDFHAGKNDYPYTDKKGGRRTLHHSGARNVAAALKASQGFFPRPDQLLITGESAGAFGCIAQAENVIRNYPDCKHITVLSDSAQLAYPGWKAVVRDVWKADRELWECIESNSLSQDWFRLLYRKFGDRLTYLHACSYHDAILTIYQKALNTGVMENAVDQDGLAQFQAGLAEAQKTLLREIPEFRCYISDWGENKKTGATTHCAMRTRLFHTKNSAGISLADWLDDAVNRGKRANVGLDLLEKSR
jgi:hypothetical protein